MIHFRIILLLKLVLFCQSNLQLLEEQPQDDPFMLEKNKQFTQQLINDFKYDTLQTAAQEFKYDNLEESKQILEEIAPQAKDQLKEILFGIAKDDKSFENHFIDSKQQLILFDKTRKYFYNGIFNKEDVLNWLKNHIQKEIIQLNEKVQFDNFYKTPNKTKILAIYDSQMKKERLLLEVLIQKEVFSDSGNFLIGITDDQSIVPFPDQVEMPCLVMYKEFQDENQHIIYNGNLTDSNEIVEWAQINSLPLVTTFSEQTAFRLFAGPVQTQMIIFLDPKQEIRNKQYLEEFTKAAKYNRDEDLYYERILFMIVYLENSNKDMLSHFNIDEDSIIPQIFLTTIDNKKQQMDRYEYTKDEIIEEFIKDFIIDFRKKTLERFYKSEKEPSQEEQDKLELKKLVGKQYREKVIRNKENVVVLYCTMEYENLCKAPYKYIELIAKKIKEIQNDFVNFYYFDVVKNEVDGLNLDDIPQVLIYMKGEKNRPKKFYHEYTIKNLLQYFNGYFERFIGKIEVSDDENQEVIFSMMDQEDQQILKQMKDEKNNNKKNEEMIINQDIQIKDDL